MSSLESGMVYMELSGEPGLSAFKNGSRERRIQVPGHSFLAAWGAAPEFEDTILQTRELGLGLWSHSCITNYNKDVLSLCSVTCAQAMTWVLKCNTSFPAALGVMSTQSPRVHLLPFSFLSPLSFVF